MYLDSPHDETKIAAEEKANREERNGGADNSEVPQLRERVCEWVLQD